MMVQHQSASDREQVVETMIGLTHLTNLHRAIIAGNGSMEFYLVLRQRGFLRVATAQTCRTPKAQHPVGLIAGHNSLQAIEAAIVELSPFLGTSAAVAVLNRFARNRRRAAHPGAAGANGFSDRSRCPVPGGVRAFRHPARLWPDGKGGVKSPWPQFQLQLPGLRATYPTFPLRSMNTARWI